MGARSSRLDGIDNDVSWSLFDSAPDAMVVVSTSGDVVFVNQQAAALFGAPSDQLVDRPVDDLLPPEVRGAHRAHRNRYRARPDVRGMGADLQLRAVRVDGSEFHAEISLSPLELGAELFVVAAVRDIGARVASEDHLHRVLRTLDASADGLFIFDADTLQYSHVNEGAVRLVGYAASELVGMTPVHLNPYRGEAEYRELIAELFASPERTVHREARLLRRDGVEVPVEKTYQAAPEARDGSRWIIAVARDISARLAHEEEMRQSQDALRQAEQVLLLVEDRDRIARDLHDTVIQRLFGVGLGLQTTLATADDRTRARLDTAIDEIDTTIRELRTTIFSLQGSRVAPEGLRGRILTVISDAGRASGVEPRLEFEGSIDTLDDRIVEHLVPTLREALSNVAHHAQARSVRVVLSVTDDVVLSVTDDGIGMSREVIGGNGLTNMAHRATELGGTATLTPGPKSGCRFEWRVPLIPVTSSVDTTSPMASTHD
jgi:PAS domain S-box-containing protein